MSSSPPDGMLYEHANPCANLEFRRDLASLLNRYGIDNWAETPDIVLADTLAGVIPALRHGRIATARWMDQPLLGEKHTAMFRRPGGSAWPEGCICGGVIGAPCPVCNPPWVEDTTPVSNNLYQPGDPRGFKEYEPCLTDLCAAQRQHTVRCQARKKASAE